MTSPPPASEGAAYEVAREILGELIAIAAARIEAAAGQGTAAEAGKWDERREAWVAQLNALRPGDSDAVNTVLAVSGPLLASLRAEAS